MTRPDLDAIQARADAASEDCCCCFPDLDSDLADGPLLAAFLGGLFACRMQRPVRQVLCARHYDLAESAMARLLDAKEPTHEPS